MREKSPLTCEKCRTSISDCTCPDMDDKLQRAAMDPKSKMVFKWCIACNRQWARCQCEQPIYRLYSGGKQLDPRKIINMLGQPVSETNPEIGYDEHLS